MIDKKVMVFATGGTIAMKYDPAKHGLVPACTGEDLAAAVPGLGDVAPLEFVQFSNIASPGMTPQNMWDCLYGRDARCRRHESRRSDEHSVFREGGSE